jgi:thrombospondin type 3 repeat protein
MSNSPVTRIPTFSLGVLAAVLVLPVLVLFSGPQSQASAKSPAANKGSSSSNADADRDGLTNWREINRTRTNPRRADSDGDGLSDKTEISLTKTNPRRADSDGDGFNDGTEVFAGSDPWDPSSVPSQPRPNPNPPGGGPTPTPPSPPKDTTPPNTSIGSGPAGTTTSTVASFTFSANESSSTFACKLDSSAWASCSSPKKYSGLAVGSHQFSVRATDSVGNTDPSPATRTWTIEAVPPIEENAAASAVWETPEKALVDLPVKLDGTESTGDGPLTCTWSFENQTGTAVYETRAGCTIDFTFESTGTKYVELSVEDADGESASNKQSFDVDEGLPPDTTPPNTTIGSGPSGTTTSTGASFSFSSSESGSTFECSLDSAAFGSCPSPKSYSGLALGEHTFSVRATDGAGNVDASPATRAWTVASTPPSDTTAPETAIDSGPSGSTTATTANFGFSASEEGSSFQCMLDSSSWSTCTSPMTYSSLAVGSHTFSVRATDLAGNVDSSPATQTWTVAATPPPDTTPPNTTIGSGPSGSTTSTAASFSFTSSESGSTFACSLDSAAFGPCASPKIYSGLAVGSHTFSVRATDAAGNVDATPAFQSWTITATTPPATGTHCFASPHTCGFPDETNTGIPAGTALSPSGSITASTPGQVIDGRDVTGTINIVANNVTVQNTRVTLTGTGCGPTSTCGNYEIRINEGVSGTVIKNSELRVAAGTTCEHDIRNTSGPSLQIIGVYIHGCDSNLYGGGTMTDSYGVAKLDISNDHVENIYFNDTSFTSIHNTLLNPISQTAVIFGNSNGGTATTNCTNQLTVTNSLIVGGGYTLYPCAHAAQAGSSTINVQNNHFGRCTSAEVYNPNGGTHTCANGTDSSGYYPFGGAYGMATEYFNGTGTWKGNVWDDNLAPVCMNGSPGCS